jgi:hypothetical protein
MKDEIKETLAFCRLLFAVSAAFFGSTTGFIVGKFACLSKTFRLLLIFVDISLALCMVALAYLILKSLKKR